MPTDEITHKNNSNSQKYDMVAETSSFPEKKEEQSLEKAEVQPAVEQAQIMFTGLFTLFGLTVVEHILRPRGKKQSKLAVN
ncbi:MAG: hypothetical protein KJO60_13075 [Desulfofustis sp.]|nr:hypothetical protein [Desulfofustis sp.]